MTSLRQQMTDEMQLRGLSSRTQQSYLNAVRQLAEYYHKPPDQIDEEELRPVLPLSDEREAALAQQLPGRSLRHPFPLCEDAWPGLAGRSGHSATERDQVAGCAQCGRGATDPGLRAQASYRVCLSTIYACGLRLNEGISLQVADIDGERMLLHVRQGKGAKDRYVPLPETTL